ncbi:hypothetical protein ACIBCA_16750 [Kitasatospora sp. NPDC051170]
MRGHPPRPALNDAFLDTEVTDEPAVLLTQMRNPDDYPWFAEPLY